MNSRTQLTLFVPNPLGAELDAHRSILDPVQASLIATHVTLCREDEIVDLTPDQLTERISMWSATSLTLEFGPPKSFFEHGILLPCISGTDEFHALRCWILDAPNARRQHAHITLAHPRNPRSQGNTSAYMAELPTSLHVTFKMVTLIEQQGHTKWRILHEASLGARQHNE